jgi:DNA helicase HerA-like ATPase
MTKPGSPLGHVVSVEGASVCGLLNGPDKTNAAGGSAPEDAVTFGGMVKIRTAKAFAFGMVSRVWIGEVDASCSKGQKMINVDLLGEAIPTNGAANALSFRRSISIYPQLGADILPVTKEDMAMIYARPDGACVRVGSISAENDLAAYVLTDALLGKHFAILGTTGSGKTCSVSLILRSILDVNQNGHIVILDPHNEYGKFFGDSAAVFNPENMHLPYWMMNFEELCSVLVSKEGDQRQAETLILKHAVREARIRYAGDDAWEQITVDTPVPFRLGELERIIGDSMGQLNRAESSSPYVRLQHRIESLSADPRYAFMFAGLLVRDTMSSVLSRLLRIPVNGKPVTIIDLSDVPGEITDVVVSVLCRLTFDFAVWSSSNESVPVLLVCEEAHRYVPQDGSLGFDLTRQSISRIAKEGRKYGVSICLVSQRPTELSTTILSQCNTVFALRMSNAHDQSFVQRALPDAAGGLLSALPSLDTREAIAVGEGVSLPMRLLFDELGTGERPRSGTAAFAKSWQDDTADIGFVDRTIERWRARRREEPDAWIKL